MSEEHLIRNCAPTLAGLKTGNLFSCTVTGRQELLDFVRDMNRRLVPKGLRLLPLKIQGNKTLIYLYRPSRLTADLADSGAARILRQKGYAAGTCEACISQLARKIRAEQEFPHEIGLFLGYPVEDVLGFMENRACSCKCAGCWKVYGDEEAAKRKFAQYKKCTRVYCDRWAQGTDIERLTVAG